MFEMPTMSPPLRTHCRLHRQAMLGYVCIAATSSRQVTLKNWDALVISYQVCLC